MRRIFTMLGILLFILVVWFGLTWLHFLYNPLIKDPQGIKFKVAAGATYKVVSSELYQQHIIKHPHLMNLLFMVKGDVHHLKAGEYLFQQGTTASKMLHQMVTGTGLVYYTFTIIPGMTFKQVRQLIDENENLDHATQKLSDADIMIQLGHAGLNPEGQFYPDTYFFMKDSPDLLLLKRANHAMDEKLNNAWEHRDPNLPFKTVYEALIAASIIEKEAHKQEELPVIAGVMVNRLRQNILLQFDPTVIYGMGSRYDGTIYKSDLADNNPYNTYVHKGLPPTPISMPSVRSIHAVMHPEANDYLYFVAKGDHATHQFSRTLIEHQAAIAEAKKFRPDYVNEVLIKKYLQKSITQNYGTLAPSG